MSKTQLETHKEIDDLLEAEECEFCGGKNGEHEEITTSEAVYPGEPHMADIGSRKCPALDRDDDEYDDQGDY